MFSVASSTGPRQHSLLFSPVTTQNAQPTHHMPCLVWELKSEMAEHPILGQTEDKTDIASHDYYTSASHTHSVEGQEKTPVSARNRWGCGELPGVTAECP
jgi:hypothetical protein